MTSSPPTHLRSTTRAWSPCDARPQCGRSPPRGRTTLRPVAWPRAVSVRAAVVRSAAEGAQAVADVDELGIVASDELEPARCLDGVAAAVVQIAQHVPLAEVVVAHALGIRHLAGLVHRAQRAGEIAAVDLRA